MRSPPITRGYSRPNSLPTSSTASFIRLNCSGLPLKSLSGSFLKSANCIYFPPPTSLHAEIKYPMSDHAGLHLFPTIPSSLLGRSIIPSRAASCQFKAGKLAGQAELISSDRDEARSERRL